MSGTSPSLAASLSSPGPVTSLPPSWPAGLLERGMPEFLWRWREQTRWLPVGVRIAGDNGTTTVGKSIYVKTKGNLQADLGRLDEAVAVSVRSGDLGILPAVMVPPGWLFLDSDGLEATKERIAWLERLGLPPPCGMWSISGTGIHLWWQLGSDCEGVSVNAGRDNGTGGHVGFTLRNSGLAFVRLFGTVEGLGEPGTLDKAGLERLCAALGVRHAVSGNGALSLQDAHREGGEAQEGGDSGEGAQARWGRTLGTGKGGCSDYEELKARAMRLFGGKSNTRWILQHEPNPEGGWSERVYAVLQDLLHLTGNTGWILQLWQDLPGARFVEMHPTHEGNRWESGGHGRLWRNLMKAWETHVPLVELPPPPPPVTKEELVEGTREPFLVSACLMTLKSTGLVEKTWTGVAETLMQEAVDDTAKTHRFFDALSTMCRERAMPPHSMIVIAAHLGSTYGPVHHQAHATSSASVNTSAWHPHLGALLCIEGDSGSGKTAIKRLLADLTVTATGALGELQEEDTERLTGVRFNPQAVAFQMAVVEGAEPPPPQSTYQSTLKGTLLALSRRLPQTQAGTRDAITRHPALAGITDEAGFLKTILAAEGSNAREHLEINHRCLNDLLTHIPGPHGFSFPTLSGRTEARVSHPSFAATLLTQRNTVTAAIANSPDTLESGLLGRLITIPWTMPSQPPPPPDVNLTAALMEPTSEAGIAARILMGELDEHGNERPAPDHRPPPVVTATVAALLSSCGILPELFRAHATGEAGGLVDLASGVKISRVSLSGTQLGFIAHIHAQLTHRAQGNYATPARRAAEKIAKMAQWLTLLEFAARVADGSRHRGRDGDIIPVSNAALHAAAKFILAAEWSIESACNTVMHSPDHDLLLSVAKAIRLFAGKAPRSLPDGRVQVFNFSPDPARFEVRLSDVLARSRQRATAIWRAARNQPQVVLGSLQRAGIFATDDGKPVRLIGSRADLEHLLTIDEASYVKDDE